MKAPRRTILALLAFLAFAACDNPLRERIERLVGDYDSILRERAVYVDGTRGDDGNPGTRELPRRSIQSAVDLLEDLGIRGEVRVAEGTYQIRSPLRIEDGIAVCGGYSESDWGDRDIEGNPTVLQGSGVEDVVTFAEGAGEETLLEGFTVRAASGDKVDAVYCKNCSPTIRYNHIDASGGSLSSIGVINSSSSPLIEANTIDAGDGTVTRWGIANKLSNARVRNNVIYSTAAAGSFEAIHNGLSSAAVIQNNTIHIGGHINDIGIRNVSGRCVLENNIVYSDPETACGIYEDSSAALPLRVKNNDLYGCATVYHHAGGDCLSVDDMQTYLGAGCASANVSDEPAFVDADDRDYHLAGPAVAGAGLDLSAWFATDRDGNPRTASWSIGAYERD
jgi:hypothetical protein